MSQKKPICQNDSEEKPKFAVFNQTPKATKRKILCFLVEFLLLSDYPNGRVTMEPQQNERNKDYFNPKGIIHRTGMQRLPRAGFSLFLGQKLFRQGE